MEVCDLNLDVGDINLDVAEIHHELGILDEDVSNLRDCAFELGLKPGVVGVELVDDVGLGSDLGVAAPCWWPKSGTLNLLDD